MVARERRPWTEKDVEDLKAAWSRGDTVAEISKALRRTEAAIHNKAKYCALGARGQVTVRKPIVPWDPVLKALERARRAKGVTYSVLAHRAGVHENVPSHWFRNKKSPRLCNLQAVAEVLGYRIVLERIEG